MKSFAMTLMSLWLAACTTTRPLPLPEFGYGIDEVRAGDRVEVVTRDGKRHRFDVARIDEEALYSAKSAYAYRDMRSAALMVRQPMNRNTVWLVVGLLAVGLALASDPGPSIYGPFCVYSSTDPDPSC